MNATERYNQITRAIATGSAAHLAGILIAHNVHISQQGQKSIEEMLYSMLVNFRQAVLADVLRDYNWSHIQNYHQEPEK